MLGLAPYQTNASMSSPLIGVSGWFRQAGKMFSLGWRMVGKTAGVQPAVLYPA
jgi:hypothetical protein